VKSQTSFDNITSKWVVEKERHVPSASVILVATQVDLRYNLDFIEELKENNRQIITSQQGINLAKRINAIAYVETSALEGYGAKELIHLIGAVHQFPYPKKKRKCKTQ
jgi:GTPase SAR1 family protein